MLTIIQSLALLYVLIKSTSCKSSKTRQDQGITLFLILYELVLPLFQSHVSWQVWFRTCKFTVF